MEKWFVAAKKADFDKWAEEFQISPVLARILRNRDLTQESEVREFLYGTLEDCPSPWLLRDMDKAVDAVLQAVKEQIKIRVIGDYDVDGICSSYILTKGLQILGASADTAIPHRIHDGYGLNEHLIEEAKQDGIGLIITCDNGIAAASQIELANSLGMQVVVTDHHQVPVIEENSVQKELLPSACAIVDPHRAECMYPYKNICGCVVAYKLLQALAEKANHAGLYKALEEFVELSALATECDVMELVGESRIILKEGLERMRNSHNQGIRALIEVNEIDPEKLSAHQLGFIIGPCINATGRLDTAKRALELLQSMTKVDAMTAARELKEINESRKNLTLQGVEQAEAYIAEHHIEQDKVMVVYLPDVHESIAGIIAGRVREKYNHPVFVLTKGEDFVKGSGRSIEEYHMFNAMNRVKQYFIHFGGHKLAAGLSMQEEDIEPLRRALNEYCVLTEEDFCRKVHIDVPMPISYATEELAKEMELLEPFGMGNPKPLFAQKGVRFKAAFRMGSKRSFARFRVLTPEGREETLVYFGDADTFDRFVDEKFGEGSASALYRGEGNYEISIVYQLGINAYKGREEKQFIMQNYC